MEISYNEHDFSDAIMNFSQELKRNISADFSDGIDFKYPQNDIEISVAQLVSKVSPNPANSSIDFDDIEFFKSGNSKEFMAAKDTGLCLADLTSLAGLDTDKILRDICALSIDIERLNQSVLSIVLNDLLFKEIEEQCKEMLQKKILDYEYKETASKSTISLE